ncbi:MAG: hypothetical protein RMK18_11985 [Armatimonadota bacterium]|nr:hypothetical protein [Armatimonadota bacterium]MDW8026567.1 hypothetical protein [Armatimonadota bacterium]
MAKKFTIFLPIVSVILVGLMLKAVVLSNASSQTAQESKLLLSFETASEVGRCSGAAGLQIVAQNATDGKHALRVDMTAPAPILIIRSGEKPFDFSGWDKLKLDVHREGDPVNLTLRVYDRKGSQYISWYYFVRSGFNIVEFSIWGMNSAIDVSQVDRLAFFCERPSGALLIDNIRLTRGKDDDSWLLPKEKPKPLLVPPNNIIINGDFELGLQNWGSWGQWDGGLYIFGNGVGEDAYSGLASAAITCQRVGRGGIWTHQPFRLIPGIYQLTFYVKGKGEGVRMFWALEGTNEETPPEIIKNQRSQRFDVPRQWEKREYEVVVQKDVDVRLYIYSVGGGTLFVDAVSLVRKVEEKLPEGAKWQRKMKPSKVEIRGTKIFVNGKPFIPIGIYGANPEALKGTGFNLIVTDVVGGAGSPANLEFLDRCYESGIMVSVGLTGLMRAHLPWQAPKAIEELKEHPAILAWYVCDEPDHARWTVPPPEVRLASMLLRQSDPNHLTWTVVMPWADSNIYQYSDTVDIISTDEYSFNDFYDYKPSPIAHLIRTIGVLKRAIKGDRPVWLVAEAFGKVTPKQMVASTYVALTQGVSGIIYFSFEGAIRNRQLWERLVKLSLELKELAPVIISPQPERDAKVDNENIHFAIREHENKLYLLTINASSEPQRDVKISLPWLKSDTTARVLFEDRKVPIKNGILTDYFADYERHVYEIGLK